MKRASGRELALAPAALLSNGNLSSNKKGERAISGPSPAP